MSTPPFQLPPDPDVAASSVSPTPELSEASPRPDPLADGLKALLDPSIQQTAAKLEDVYGAQQALGAELDRLIAQLKNYLETTDPPPLRDTVVKLASTKKRLEVVNRKLEEVEKRVQKVYLTLSQRSVRQASGGR